MMRTNLNVNLNWATVQVGEVTENCLVSRWSDYHSEYAGAVSHDRIIKFYMCPSTFYVTGEAVKSGWIRKDEVVEPGELLRISLPMSDSDIEKIQNQLSFVTEVDSISTSIINILKTFRGLSEEEQDRYLRIVPLLQ